MKFGVQFLIVGILVLLGSSVHATNQKSDELSRALEEYFEIKKQTRLQYLSWLRTEHKLRDLRDLLSKKIAKLVAEGADPNRALWFAAKEDDAELLELLVNYGANIHIINDSKMTLLMMTCAFRQKAFDYLLQQDVDIHATDKDDWTALFYAVINDNVDAIDRLVARGANIEKKADKDKGETPFQFAVNRGCFRSALRLLSLGAKPESPNKDFVPYFYPVDKLSTERTKTMVASFSPKSVISKKDFDAAIKKQDTDLLLKQIDELRAPNENCLHATVRLGSVAALKMLLSYLEQQDMLLILINERNGSDLTPLDIAFILRNEEIIRTLLAFDADPLHGSLNGLMLANSMKAWHIGPLQTGHIPMLEIDKTIMREKQQRFSVKQNLRKRKHHKNDQNLVATKKSQPSLFEQIIAGAAKRFFLALWPLQLAPEKRSTERSSSIISPPTVPSDIIRVIVHYCVLAAMQLVGK